MKIEEREEKWEKLRQKYGEQTHFFLEGNFGADRLCEELPPNSTHYHIQIHSASLPRFIMKDTATQKYATADMHHYVKNKMARNREIQMHEDHSELELTKFSAEVDWSASIWSMQSKTISNIRRSGLYPKSNHQTAK